MYISPQIKGMKKIDGILMSVTGYVYSPGSINLEGYLMDDDQYRDFQIYMAVTMCETVINAINQQRYKSGSNAWKPLSIKYYTWKKKHNLSLNIWEATGTLKKSLKLYRKGTYIVLGFRPDDYYKGTRLKVNKVARYVEYGGKKLTPRPLFRPLTVYVRKNVRRYYKSYLKELNTKKKKFLYIE